MKSKSIKIFLMGAAITSMLSSCGDSWFEREPKNILTNELVWNDPNMIKSQLANLYNRIPQLHGDFNTGGMCETDDAMYCGTLDQNYRNELRYGNDYGRWWDYGLIRDINCLLRMSISMEPIFRQMRNFSSKRSSVLSAPTFILSL